MESFLVRETTRNKQKYNLMSGRVMETRAKGGKSHGAGLYQTGMAKPKVSTVFGSYAPVILKDTCQYMNIHLIIDYTSSLLCCCMTWLITKYTQNIEIPKG